MQDVRQKSSLMPPPIRGGGIIKTWTNEWIACTAYVLQKIGDASTSEMLRFQEILLSLALHGVVDSTKHATLSYHLVALCKTVQTYVGENAQS